MYDHTPEDRWKTARPFVVNHRENPETKHPDGVIVHLDGDAEDLATHEGDWDDKHLRRTSEGGGAWSYPTRTDL